MDDRRVGELLVEAGHMTREDLDRVMHEEQVGTDRRLLSVLYARKLVDERALAEVLARRAGAPVAVLSESVIDLAVVRMLPPDVVLAKRVLPVSADERTITFASASGEAATLVDAIGFATNRRAIPIAAIEAALDEAIARVMASPIDQQLVIGELADSDVPFLAVAAAPAVSPEAANAFARAIIDAIDDASGPRSSVGAAGAAGATAPRTSDLEDASGSHRLAAVQLKQVQIERTSAKGRPPGVVEKNVSAPDGPAAADSAPWVLVVDDDDDIRLMLSRALTHDGVRVREASRGEEAIQILRTARPNAILLDAMLPGVHGFEICGALKRSEQFRDVPIIMISAVYRGWTHAREIQEQHGADYFVEKPFELHYVRKLIADILDRPLERPAVSVDTQAKAHEARAAYYEHRRQDLWFAAAADVDLWLSYDPFDSEAWLQRGVLCQQAGDLVGALAALEASTVYEPRRFEAHLHLALVYEQLGFLRRAAFTWRAAHMLAPDDNARALIAQRLLGMS